MEKGTAGRGTGERERKGEERVRCTRSHFQVGFRTVCPLEGTSNDSDIAAREFKSLTPSEALYPTTYTAACLRSYVAVVCARTVTYNAYLSLSIPTPPSASAPHRSPRSYASAKNTPLSTVPAAFSLVRLKYSLRSSSDDILAYRDFSIRLVERFGRDRFRETYPDPGIRFGRQREAARGGEGQRARVPIKVFSDQLGNKRTAIGFRRSPFCSSESH